MKKLIQLSESIGFKSDVFDHDIFESISWSNIAKKDAYLWMCELQAHLRDVYGLNIFMAFKPNIKKWDFIPYYMTMNAREYIKYNQDYITANSKRSYDTYELALEDGLIEGIVIIKIN